MYKQIKSNLTGTTRTDCIARSDGLWIPFDPDNTDYQEYLNWLEEGNTPEPAEEQQ